MEYVSEKDIYEIRIASLISNVDKDVVLELYQPLVGASATILYLNLAKQKRNEDDETFVFSHDQLIALMQLSPGNLLTARKALEAVGLLRTYVKEDGDIRYFIYMLFAPKSPKEFFDDVLFKGLIIQYVGEKEAKRLARHYHVDLKIPEDYKEVSASFIDVFNPNYDDASFRKNIGDSLFGHDSGRVKINFNYDLFFKYVENNSQIIPEAFSKKDMREIERLAALFGLDEKTMANIVISEYRGDITPHLDFGSVAELAKEQIRYPELQAKTVVKSHVSGDSLLAKKINLMERTSPANWLKLLQNNTKPASSDLDIVNCLSKDYGFSAGVINAIIDYVLTKNNNILSKKYCEKIASSLARENTQTAVDAMNYLNKTANGSKPRKSTSKSSNKEKIETSVIEASSVSDEEMEDILSMFDKKGGKK